MKTINERIMHICVDKYEGNLLKFAKATNISTPTIRCLCGVDLRSDNLQSPKYDQIISIYKVSGVSIEWLMLGNGAMYEDKGDIVEPNPTILDNVHERTRELQDISVQDPDECDRLRAQNDVLSNSLSSIISQMQSLIDTNKRLTDLLINSSNACDIPATD